MKQKNAIINKQNFNYAFFQQLKKYLLKKATFEEEKTANEALFYIEQLAKFNAQLHTGLFADADLENLALHIGKKLETIVNQTFIETINNEYLAEIDMDKRNVLHIFTRFANVGGHTRIVKNWFQLDNKHTCHHVLLLDQTTELPSFINDSLLQNIIQLPAAESRLRKAYILRHILRNNRFQNVILHTHPHDTVPLVALANDASCSVALFNHADHLFGLGSSVADVILDFRGFSQNISLERRMAKKSVVLPMPIEIKKMPINKKDARDFLEIPDEQIALVTINTENKFQPTEKHNFYRTAKKLLAKHKQAHIYMIGVSESDFYKHGNTEKIERLHTLGRIENPIHYFAAADIYLEGFPIGSGMGSIEFGLQAVCLVPQYSPSSHLLSLSSYNSLEGAIEICENESDYISYISDLIDSPTKRTQLGKDIQTRLYAQHLPAAWQNYLRKAYALLDTKTHRPKNIARTFPRKTSEDISLTALRLNMPCLIIAQPLLKHLPKWLILSLFFKSYWNGDVSLQYLYKRYGK
ncbi:MAG: hypothetical protein ACPG5B_09310 [Chitinophagales bacterium]